MNLILFGHKSSGKTTFGQSLAKSLHYAFLDTDHLLEELYYTRTGTKKSFREIAQELGEKGFRDLESTVISQLSMVENSVIALGGGVVLNPQNTALLAKLGPLIYLKIRKETLKKRILGQELPTFLDPSHPEESFEKMFTERQAKYEAISAISIDLETQTQDQILLQIRALIKDWERSHGQ